MALTVGCGAPSQTGTVNQTNTVNTQTTTGSIPAAKKYSGPSVATYTGGSLTKQEFDEAYNLMVALPGLETQETKKAFVSYYIVWYKYLYNQAMKADPSFTPDPSTANQQADQTLQQLVGQGQPYTTQADLDAKMKSLGITRDDMVRLAANMQVIQNYLQAQMKNLQVTDAEAQTYYNQNKAGFVQVTVDQILVSSLDKAKSIEKQWKAGADFVKLADANSIDPGVKTNHGTYADQLAMSFVAPFAKACETLPIGQISDPIQTQYGYHVIRVDKRTQMSFAQVKDQIKQQLLPTMQNQKEQAVYTSAQKAANVKVTVADSAL